MMESFLDAKGGLLLLLLTTMLLVLFSEELILFCLAEEGWSESGRSERVVRLEWSSGWLKP